MSRFAIVMFQGTPCILKILTSNNLFINDAKVTSSDTKNGLEFENYFSKTKTESR